MFKAFDTQPAFCSLLDVIIFIISLYPANNSVRGANQVFIHSSNSYHVIIETSLFARSALNAENTCAKYDRKGNWGLENKVILPKSSEPFDGGTGTHTQLCHVAWGSSLVYTYLTAHFCTQKFKVVIIPLLSLSPSSFLLLIYILLNDEIIQYIIPQQLCYLKKKLGME